MQLVLKNSTGRFLLIVGIIACSTVLIKPVHARAKSGVFDKEDDGWGDGWSSEEEQEEEIGGKQAAPAKQEASADHSHHHNPEPVLVAAAPLGAPGVQQSWDPKQGGGMQSANFAAHNESCSPAGKSCPKEQNLECSTTDGTGRCQCTSPHVYVRQTESCWVIPKSDQDVCSHDIQCHAGKWGAHSRCSKQSARCECYDYQTGGKREMSLVEGVCYIKKSIGDLCNSDEECDKTILGDAYCKRGDHQSGSGQNYNGSCQCLETHMYWQPFKACLKLATKLNDNCRITEQCQQGSLGQRSRCAGDGHCECYSQHNGTEVVYYEKLSKCFKRKQYNDTCNDVDECRASLGPDVECDTTEDYPDDKVCHCPAGKVCRNSGFSTLLATSSFITSLAFAAAVIGISSMMNGRGEL